MSRFKTTFGGLGSRVALRTLMLFVVSAVLPIAIFAFVADRVVSEKLHRQATERLAQTSKSYGLLLFDRLMQTQAAMDDMATLVLSHGLSAASLSSYHSDRFRLVYAQIEPSQSARPTPSHDTDLSTKLETRHSGNRDVISLHLTRSRGGTTISMTAELSDEFLWDADAVLLPGASICVESVAARLQRCQLQESSSGDSQIAASWSLFLGPQLGGATWIITTRQSRADALQALRSFEGTFPVVTSVAILLALLLGMTQIRRSHRPLDILTRAAAHMARRQFHKRVEIHTNDEYAHLGRAFNQMSSALSKQFALLRMLSRVDRMILTDPEPDVVVSYVLPLLPQLLRTRAVVLIVANASAAELVAFVATADAGGLQRIPMADVPLEGLLGSVETPHLACLPSLADENRVFGTPLRIGGTLRGALIIADPSKGRRTRLRGAKAFARRFAVALGNAERRHALITHAYYDELTGLPNRRLFKERLELALQIASGSGRRLAIVYIDLDRFKDVNDSLGHSAGDALLIAVCDRLKATVRDTDTLARMGGDEFVLIASDIERDPAHLLAGRLQSALAEPIELEGTRCFVQASIGLTVYPQDGSTVETLLRNADIAMYRAKSQGRGVCTYFEEQMDREARQRHRVEQRLRHALQTNALTLYYQPKVNLADGAIHGVEALARWTDDELGTVSPGVFIPIAEDCGLIGVLGQWALREACMAFQRQARAGLDLGHVSVNVSMRQLNSTTFVDDVRTILDQAGMAPAALEFELTESAVAADPERALSLIAELRAIGVRTSIDDFGTGYSSMSALAVLPADSLKIDRSFIVNCAFDRAAQSVVAAIISMAHVLGKMTVAEGVETIEQLQSLRNLGCDYIQGYLMSKPLPEAALPSLASEFGRWAQIVRPEGGNTQSIASYSEELLRPADAC